MPGPPPKPTALKALQGNPGKRALNKSEPKYKGTPKCPDWLTKLAKVEWKRITGELAELDLLRAVDTAALAAYCVAYARWQTAEQIVESEGQTVQEPITNKSGEVVAYKTKRHPATIIAKDERAAMHRAAQLFEFDPASRSRVSLPDAPQTDPFEAFLKELPS